MKPFVFCCLAVALFSLTVHAGAQNNASIVALTAQDKQHILRDTFTESRRVSAIPDSVKQAFIGRISPTFLMAEPGQPFNEGDAGHLGVPWQRLHFVATNKDYCILHYEHGGFGGARQIVAVFHTVRGKADVLCTSPLRNVLPDLKVLRLVPERDWLFPAYHPNLY